MNDRLKANPIRYILLALGLGLIMAGPLAAQERAGPAPEEEPGLPISPRGAFLRSLVLPGWGQAYVGSPSRGAVYFSLAGGSVWMSYVAHRQLRDARQQQEWLRSVPGLEFDPTLDSEFVQARARHFEDWVALSLFLFFFAGADAYVSAYLADFDERMGVRPGADGSLRFEARLPIGGPR